MNLVSCSIMLMPGSEYAENDLDGVFHPELPVHVNKQADLPAYLKQLALERIGDIPIDAVQNPDDCSVFLIELIAIDEAVGSLASLPNGNEIWILSHSRSAMQHLSNWQSHHWYQCSRPGGSLAYSFTRQDQTLLARFRSGHIKTMKFSEGRKSFEMCTNCSSEPATPAHILECLGLTKQDLADDPLLVLDFLKVYVVMDLV
ncbi:uncharacterized protein TNCV_652881 [Trichonephila clavipes]|nr:uncharacterized protein TNCV_652881 [Trichonephila clavipes]